MSAVQKDLSLREMVSSIMVAKYYKNLNGCNKVILGEERTFPGARGYIDSGRPAHITFDNGHN